MQSVTPVALYLPFVYLRQKLQELWKMCTAQKKYVYLNFVWNFYSRTRFTLINA
jgi:hypothetical protein